MNLQQQELHIPDESRVVVMEHAAPCPKCGISYARLEIMVNPMANGFIRRYRVVCRILVCGGATEWMDSSQKALQVWKVQSILARK